MGLVIVAIEWVSLLAELFINATTANVAKVYRMLRIIKSIKVFVRMFRLVQLFGKLGEHVRSHVFSVLFGIIKMGIVLAIVVHFFCCVWFAIGRINDDGWVYKRGIENEPFLFQYTHSARWTLAQINGRVDQQEATMFEMSFTCAIAMFTVLFVSVFIGGLTTRMMVIQKIAEE